LNGLIVALAAVNIKVMETAVVWMGYGMAVMPVW
jgi:hypothetical protein